MKLNPCLLASLLGTASFFPTFGASPVYIKASNTSALDNFGYCTAISGSTMVIGAYLEASSATGVNGNQNNENAFAAGAAYIYTRESNGWIQQAYLKPSVTTVGDLFGSSVAISGDTVVVGANSEDGLRGNNSGAAYVFVRSGTNWLQQAYLKASNGEPGDQFGISVAISGNTIVVGAHREAGASPGVNGNQGDNSAAESGAAYVFVRNGTNWSQQAYLKSSNPGTNDWFGTSVAVSGETVAVGAYREDSNANSVNGNQANNGAPDAGAAYVFVRTGTNWQQQAYIKASNTESNDQFGYSLAISGETLVIGANQERSNATGVNGDQSNNNAINAGAAYVFARTGTNWQQHAYLKASNTQPTNNFGESVAISGDSIVVGAYYESSDATGVNGNQDNAEAKNAGAAYLFKISGTNWIQRAYLKASNTQAGDWFGRSVSISGDSIVAGAFGEDSAAIGINGDQNDNTAQGSGAAYVFEGLGLETRLSIASDNGGGFILSFNRILGVTYQLQRALTVAGPWLPIDTQTADSSDLYIFNDTVVPVDQGFYRVQVQN